MDQKNKKSFFQTWIRINFIFQFWFRTNKVLKSFHPIARGLFWAVTGRGLSVFADGGIVELEPVSRKWPWMWFSFNTLTTETSSKYPTRRKNRSRRLHISVQIQKPAVSPPPPTTLLPNLFVDISFKDDISLFSCADRTLGGRESFYALMHLQYCTIMLLNYLHLPSWHITKNVLQIISYIQVHMLFSHEGTVVQQINPRTYCGENAGTYSPVCFHSQCREKRVCKQVKFY